jgi:hypothetical protein
MKRRAFLAVSSQTAMLAMAAGAAKSAGLGQSREFDPLSTVEQRVAAVIQAYDAQGNHRTGTAVDRQSGEWLAARVREMGVEPVLEPFTLNRIDARTCYVCIADRRIDAVPPFDAGFTSAEGTTGRLGPLGSDAEIAVVESEPARLANTDPVERDHVEEARRGPHKGVVVSEQGAGSPAGWT